MVVSNRLGLRFGAGLLTIVLVFGALALLGNGLVEPASAAASGSVSASPNPAADVVSVGVGCTWSGATVVLGGGGGECMVDNIAFYSSVSVNGQGGKTYPAGALSDGSHKVQVCWATGWNPTTHAFSWSCSSITLQILHCYTDTITFHVYETYAQYWGSMASITFGTSTYVDSTPTNPQTATVYGSCGISYLIQANTVAGFPFQQWVTTTDGSFDNIAQNPTSFHPGSLSGSIDLIIYGFMGTIGNYGVGGYMAYAPSMTQASATFTLPTSLSYVKTVAPNTALSLLPLGVTLGGINGNGPAGHPAFWQAGVLIVVPSAHTKFTICDSDPGSGQCWTSSTTWMCGYTSWFVDSLFVVYAHYYCDQVPGMKGGDNILVSSTYSSQYGTVSFEIHDLTTGYGYLSAVTYTPELTTAGWGVLEAPCLKLTGDPKSLQFVYSCYGMPTFNDIPFSGIRSSAFPNLAGSVTNAWAWGYALYDNVNLHQTAVPTGLLAQANPGAFTVRYVLQY